ncbi:hypothetical protein BHE74_00045406 [Ensete ventricosum]|nr:hypothetical protein BHE74_00045406 [Ensete ventricosum]
MEDEYQECIKENVFGVDTNSGSLMHIARLSLDWGQKEIESKEKQDLSRWMLVFSVDISGMGINFGFQHVESLVCNLMSFRSLIKSFSSSSKRATEYNVGHLGNSAKGAPIFKLNLEKCSISYHGEVNVDDTVVADPKRVNFGSHGGEVLISVSADGTPRRASIISMLTNKSKILKFSTSLDIFHFSLCVNREKESTQVELERARSFHMEFTEGHEPGNKVALFDMQNAKFVRRTGGLTDVAVCSLFSVTDITARWEPDAHLALYEIFTRVRFLLHNSKLRHYDNDIKLSTDTLKEMEREKMATKNQVRAEKQPKKREAIFAVDIEMLRVSAEVADGVETVIHVQSIFSENARIGVLLEGLMLSFNNARVFKSSRMQISCIPVPPSNIYDTKTQPVITRDWVIQGLDVHICMPYRLQLRAIEDAVEDMFRGLKLIIASKTSHISPVKKDKSKTTKIRSEKLGSVRFVIRKLTAEIEEEPIQGWLDEHYHLIRNEVCESAVRMKFLDEILSSVSKIVGNSDQSDLNSERRIVHNGVEIDVNDVSSIERLQEDIHKKAFKSYYQACQKIEHAEGSGACHRGFQAGFRPSSRRTSLLSLCATDLDVTLTRIEGGDPGMVQFIKKIDPVCSDNDISFSRLYGRDVDVNAGSLVAQLRDYTFPLFSATAGKCKGRVVFAQQKGKISFGVGYEPAFADISYAFTVALRRANLSIRNQSSNSIGRNSSNAPHATNFVPESQPPKRERSLPWWDDMRYYIHGKIVLNFNETRWNLLATTNPYEELDKLQIVSDYMEIQQTDGHVFVAAKEFRIYISSLESLLKSCSLKLPRSVSRPFIYSPAFSLEVVLDWECESGTPLNHYLHALPNEREPRIRVYDPFRSTSLSLKWNFSLRPFLLDGNATSGFGDNLILDQAIYDTSQKSETVDFPLMNLGAHDLVWIFKWWNLNYNPPYKLRSFSRWPRFGIPRASRSGNLSLDKVMTEFFLRLDATPTCIKHMPLGDDDPASGLTFRMSKLKYELYYSRGKQRYTFDCKRDPLDLVYRGLDLHMLKAYLNRDCSSSAVQDIQTNKRALHTVTTTPKADPARLLAWQEAGRKNLEMTYVRSEFENGSESDHTRSDPSDDDGFNVVIADNCQRIFVYGLKLLWTLENRDAVWSWVGGISKAFEPPKPSPSRQYAQRKLIEEQQKLDGSEVSPSDNLISSSSATHLADSPSKQIEILDLNPTASSSTKIECLQSDIVGEFRKAPYRVVHIGPPADRYEDRPLSGGTA